ncbi:acetyl-CoA carboxylase [Natribaculum luteum]|uniref:Biotin carboxyl carrier protein of acetyl-CoA carboxylase n=1 Tax=Natribaculum luteum TaxID=1586232 RepID=A0ABD5P0Z6_9EURY|nr:acetyl-CoA carboxylase [Natribaculum luteum]
MATEYLTAPMPGVFYRRPDPDDPPFVEVGDDVSEGETVALVGVMKNFHDVTASSSGTVSEILVDDEAEIEAGQELIELTTDD